MNEKNTKKEEKEVKSNDETKEKTTQEVKSNKKTQKEIEAGEYIAKLNDDLETQRKKTDEYYDSLRRNMAEFDNFKKRITKEKDGLYDSILCDIVEKLLPIVDNFDKAKDSECKDDSYKEGISMIHNQLKELFDDYGVEKIEDIGKTFDPDLHEAVMSITDESKGEKEIVEVFRSGYKLKNKDKIIRHSLVKVAN